VIIIVLVSEKATKPERISLFSFMYTSVFERKFTRVAHKEGKSSVRLALVSPIDFMQQQSTHTFERILRR
jgi:hypothetical protein